MAIIVPKSKLKKLIITLKKKKLCIVVTNGCFDLIHKGHIEIFKKSKKLGDKLIVLVNSDNSIKRLKGSSRPIILLKDRLSLLTSIKYIDYIVTFNSLTPVDLYKTIKPNFLTKGSEYKIQKLAGEKIIRKFNGKIKLIKMLPGLSTTNIIEKIKKL